MRRPILPFVLFILMLCGALLLGMNGCGGGTGTSSPPPTPAHKQLIQHIVVIFQENRSTDNLFHDPVLIARGADIAGSGLNSAGQTVPLTPVPLANTYDLDHSHKAFVEMFDNGKMDGADKITPGCDGPCPSNIQFPSNPQFKYVNPQDVQPYFTLAEQYTFGDRMFQTNQGPSFPAHQFIISGTSAPTTASTSFAAENPDLTPVGCVAPPAERVDIIDATGKETSRQYPCFEHPTLIDEMDANDITWRYYSPSIGVSDGLWTGPNAIRHLCQPQVVNGIPVCTGNEWSHVTSTKAQVIADVDNKQLPQVSWVVPDGAYSDHPVQNNGSGPSWVASIVNSIGNSSYWYNTAIIITWDDWGGWYDHVAPKVITDGKSWGSGYVYGFRVPLIVVSPYAKPAYISHITHDFGSILKLMEETFGLSSLGYADVAADDLSDCFNFNQTPLKFQTIPAPLGPDYFLHDTSPALAPDND